MKKAFLFPGQGSQSVGMGREFYNSFDIVKDTYLEAEKTLGMEIRKVSFEGGEEELNKTDNTQPALLTLSIALHRLLAARSVTPHFVAGHSLGEYSALVAARVITFQDALILVKNRGALMQNAGTHSPGAMVAVVGLTLEVIKDIRFSLRSDGYVDIANINSPDQIVISGEVAAVERFMQLAEEKGCKKLVKLPVSGAFHSRLMGDAASEYEKIISPIDFKPPVIPIVFNVTGEIENDPIKMKELMIKQITHSVQWANSMNTLVQLGVTQAFEVGPGKVLKVLMRKIDRNVAIVTTDGIEAFQENTAPVLKYITRG